VKEFVGQRDDHIERPKSDGGVSRVLLRILLSPCAFGRGGYESSTPKSIMQSLELWQKWTLACRVQSQAEVPDPF
jgi:hypothetical protein